MALQWIFTSIGKTSSCTCLPSHVHYCNMHTHRQGRISIISMHASTKPKTIRDLIMSIANPQTSTSRPVESPRIMHHKRQILSTADTLHKPTTPRWNLSVLPTELIEAVFNELYLDNALCDKVFRDWQPGFLPAQTVLQRIRRIHMALQVANSHRRIEADGLIFSLLTFIFSAVKAGSV